MDFSLTSEINDMCRRIRMFVDEYLLPLELDSTIYDEYESIFLDAKYAAHYKGRLVA